MVHSFIFPGYPQSVLTVDLSDIGVVGGSVTMTLLVFCCLIPKQSVQ